MSLVSKPENLFQNLTQNFFKYPCPKIQEFFTNPESLLSEEISPDLRKRMFSTVQEFLQFTIYLMNDELSLLNLQDLYKKESYGETKFTLRNQAILQKFLINLLQGYYWTTISDIKNVISSFIYDQAEVDQILSKITTYDEQNHKIRIKDQYEGKFDPYLFYRVPSIRQSLSEAVLAKDQKAHKVDLISGVYYSDLPVYLKEVQKKFYASGLVDFLSLYIKTFSSQTACLLPSVLKLILLNLQVLNENYPTEEELKKKVQENYMTPEFTNSLQNLLSNEAFSKECEACLQNIQALLKTLSSELNSRKEVPAVEEFVLQASPNKEEEKKRLAKERMEKLKSDFMMKQAQFSEKNQQLIGLKSEESKESSPDSVINKNHVCQHCMEEVHDSGDEYGLLTYMTFTNNFYNCEGSSFKEQDYTNFAEADWWPVISSCGHYYHKKCFESLEKVPLGTIKNYFYNQSESFCRLCRALCNNFLTINPKSVTVESPAPALAEVQEEEAPKAAQEEATAPVVDGTNEEWEDQEEGETPPVSPREEGTPPASPRIEKKVEPAPPSFMDKIQNITKDLKKKLTLVEENNDDTSVVISPEVIFRRAYSYFIEAFHLQTNPKTLSKTFELYSYFFRAFEPTFQQDRKTLNQNQDSSVTPPLNQTSLNLITYILQKQEENSESSLQIDDLAIQVSTNILQETLSGDPLNRNSEILITQLISLLKDYILLKLIQFLPNTKDYLQLYEQYIIHKATILDQISFALQKIALATQLNKQVALDLSSNSSELFRLLLGYESIDEASLTQLLHSIGLAFSFDQFIQEILSELPKRPETHLKLFNNLANTATKAVVKQAPKIFKLPESYADFNSKYFAAKCGLCKKYSAHMFTAICLICGETMCVAYCHNEESGNLNRHARKYHMGMSLFIDIQQLNLRLISSPFNLTYTNVNVFINKLGQSVLSAIEDAGHIKVKELDFGQFKLNGDYEKIVKELIGGQAIRKELFAIAIKTGGKDTDGFQ